VKRKVLLRYDSFFFKFFRETLPQNHIFNKYYIASFRWDAMSYTISRPRIIEIIDQYQAAATSSRVRYPELLKDIRELLSLETADD